MSSTGGSLGLILGGASPAVQTKCGSLMHLDAYHPVTRDWFASRFGQPTEPQRLGWPAIFAGHDTLIAAPTGSGKTLSAFLACLDRLVRDGLAGALEDTVRVVYVSPLKALSNDIQRNLLGPLEELRQYAAKSGAELPEIRVGLRTGDTSPSARQAMLRRPPHIMVTTPESLYLLLTGTRSREILRDVDTVIVDEIHALARDKRGSHLSLTLERLEEQCEARPVRIGLSATQRPIDQIAGLLVGGGRCDERGRPKCKVIDVGHKRQLDLAVMVPPSELSAVCSHEQWDEIYSMLAEQIEQHRSTLVFVNTRRLAERVGHHLGERLGEEHVASHHGSLAREIRLNAETRLKNGQLKALVATSSLELGIDVGHVDLVCQIGSPRSIATFLQRVGRSGHALGLLPKGRLLPLSRDELLEALALVRATGEGKLDAVEIPPAPLDILAQQIVATVAGDSWDEDALFDLVRRAWPYRELSRADFDLVVSLLSYGVVPGTRRGAYLHRDGVNRQLRARRNARLTAITCGGAIPDNADYRVVAGDEHVFVGTVNEDFAIESLAGDVFQLGNTSWRIRYVRGGEVVVDDAEGAPATIPFWFGEAPGRTPELSESVSQLRSEIAGRLSTNDETLDSGDPAANGETTPQTVAENKPAIDWLVAECGCCESAAAQVASYVAAQKAALGLVPTQDEIVFERFFDESGGMQLVIHAPFGSRVNKAWGLALRKRFCRSFNFELQAAADENGIVLSLGQQHSFPLEQMFRMLNAGNAMHLLKQALLAAPMFPIRWRWNATRALAVHRQHGGKRVPPQLQRMRSDDLLSAVFPETTGCLENHSGDIDIPDHPLVEQTVFDCLQEAMDAERWLKLLEDIAAGRITLVARDTREPSPFCYEILNASPYAFLDDAPLEERRTRAVQTRRSLPIEELTELARFDPGAVAQVAAEAWPLVRDAEELHDALLWLVVLDADEGRDWVDWFEELSAQGRVADVWPHEGKRLWFAVEKWPLVCALYPDAQLARPTAAIDQPRQEYSLGEAAVATVRGHLASRGPIAVAELSERLGLRETAVAAALEALEGEGVAVQGNFSSAAANADEHHENGNSARGQAIQWCERRILARIHRLTLQGARRKVRPAPPAAYVQMLLAWQSALPGERVKHRDGLLQVVEKLAGFEAPAAAWEQEILPARIDGYDPAWIDELTLSGEIGWGRLRPPGASPEKRSRKGTAITRAMPIALVERSELPWLLPAERDGVDLERISSYAQAVHDALREHGALFFDELVAATGLLPGHVERALGELVGQGAASADGFSLLRRLMSSAKNKSPRAARRTRRATRTKAFARGGRWSRFPGPVTVVADTERIEQWARLLLRRYGVVFRDLLVRESSAPSWGELRQIYRRLEARGQVYGGRFVDGVAGEQFADQRAVEMLRNYRDGDDPDHWVVLSAADPANLFGIITSDARVPAITGNRITIAGGQLVASQQRGSVELHQQVDKDREEAIRYALRVSGAVQMAVRTGQHEQPMPRRIETTEMTADTVQS